jgi:hypothetical protein
MFRFAPVLDGHTEITSHVFPEFDQTFVIDRFGADTGGSLTTPEGFVSWTIDRSSGWICGTVRFQVSSVVRSVSTYEGSALSETEELDFRVVFFPNETKTFYYQKWQGLLSDFFTCTLPGTTSPTVGFDNQSLREGIRSITSGDPTIPVECNAFVSFLGEKYACYTGPDSHGFIYGRGSTPVSYPESGIISVQKRYTRRLPAFTASVSFV